MMQVVKISSKGQITLPRRLLISLELGPEQRVLIEKREDNIILKPLSQTITQELAGCLNKYVPLSKLGLPFEAVMQKTRRKVARHLALEK